MADQVGAISLSYGILMALWHRARTGQGSRSRPRCLGGQVMLQSFNITTTLFTRHGSAPPVARRVPALWNVYPCGTAAGSRSACSLVDRWWPLFCEATNRADLELEDDPRFWGFERIQNDHRRTDRRPRHDLRRPATSGTGSTISAARASPSRPSRTTASSQTTPRSWRTATSSRSSSRDGTETRIVGPAVQMEKSPGSIRRRAPEFGEHTEEVLLEDGFTWDEIARLQGLGRNRRPLARAAAGAPNSPD